MAVQADWLLDLSRRGLRDLDTNAWQKCIVMQLAKLLAVYISSIPREVMKCDTKDPQLLRKAIRSAFDIVCTTMNWDSGAFDVKLSDESWLAELRRELMDVPFLPILSDDQTIVAWDTPRRSVLLPNSRTVADLTLPRHAARLLPRSIVDRECISDVVLDFFLRAGLIKEMAIPDLLEVRTWALTIRFSFSFLIKLFSICFNLRIGVIMVCLIGGTTQLLI